MLAVGEVADNTPPIGGRMVWNPTWFRLQHLGLYVGVQPAKPAVDKVPPKVSRLPQVMLLRWRVRVPLRSDALRPRERSCRVGSFQADRASPSHSRVQASSMLRGNYFPALRCRPFRRLLRMLFLYYPLPSSFEF